MVGHTKDESVLANTASDYMVRNRVLLKMKKKWSHGCNEGSGENVPARFGPVLGALGCFSNNQKGGNTSWQVNQFETLLKMSC